MQQRAKNRSFVYNKNIREGYRFYEKGDELYSVIDLFCGIGGLTHGFVDEGFDVVAGIDADPSCRYAFTVNNDARFILKDIDELKAEEIMDLFPPGGLKILVGCAPCQPFSKYTKRRNEDAKWSLVEKFADLITSVRPDIVSMENVPGLRKHSVFGYFIDTLKSNGFEVSWSIVNCADYGVPQIRNRLVLFASRLGKIEIIDKTHSPEDYVTVREVISGLNPLEAGQSDTSNPLHRASALSDLNLARIASTPAGGSWRNWDKKLVLDCHKKPSGKTYSSVYGRMEWDKPAPTLTTQFNGLGNGRFGHPEQNRAISLREAALLQTFPSDYKFIDDEAETTIKYIARHIGNAVPVRLGKVIAKSIKNHIEIANERLK